MPRKAAAAQAAGTMRTRKASAASSSAASAKTRAASSRKAAAPAAKTRSKRGANADELEDEDEEQGDGSEDESVTADAGATRLSNMPLSPSSHGNILANGGTMKPKGRVVRNKPAPAAAARQGSSDELDFLSACEESSAKAKKAKSKGKAAKSSSAAKKATGLDEWASDAEDDGEDLVRIPKEQIEAMLSNYDLEAEARLERMRSALAMAMQTARERLALAVSRIPRAVRALTVRTFVDEYGADVGVFMQAGSGAGAHSALGSAAEAEKSANADADQDDELQQLLTAKQGRKRAATAAAGPGAESKKMARTAEVSAKGAAAKGKGRVASTAKAAGKESGRSSIFNSSLSAFPAASSSPAGVRGGPSAATFRPRLDAGNLGLLSTPSGSRRLLDAGLSFANGSGSGAGLFGGPAHSTTPSAAAARGLTTPGGRARVARAGEHVQWLSLNGSPLVGIIGADGRVRQLDQASSSSFAALGAGPGAAAAKTRARKGAADETILAASSSSAALLPRDSLGLGGGTAGKSAGKILPPASSDADALDDSLADDLPDEAAYTAQIIAAETSRRQQLQQQQQNSRVLAASSSSVGNSSGLGLATGSSAKRARPPQAGASAPAKSRPSIMLPHAGRELDLATASPSDLQGLSPHERELARQAIVRFHEEQRSKWL